MRPHDQRAGGIVSLRPRPALRTAAVVAAAAVFAGAIAVDAGAGAARPATTIGRDLGRLSGPRVDPVFAPARVARVAAVPGSKDLEAWAFGHTHWRNSGFAQTDPQGQGVLLSRRRGRGWRIEQPLLDQEGRPANPGVAAIDMAAGGEGWGVGNTGLIFHRPPGGQWRFHPQSSFVVNVNLTAVDVERDARGVYGWAVGPGPTFLRLENGSWSHDIGSVRGSGGTGELLGNMVSVAAVSREVAYGVAVSARELVLYRRDSTRGWERIQTGKTLFDVAPSVHPVAGGTPIVNQLATGAAVATSGGVVWVTGAIQPVDSARYVNQRGPGSDPQRPFALRIDPGGTVTSYCPRIYQLSSAGVTSTAALCDEPFPLAVGSLPGLDALPGGQVVAGGYGLFRFVGGRWTREPNVAGIVSSLSFHSPRDGWIASYGNRTAEGGSLAASSSPTVGHWTTEPETPPMLRRWPHPSRETLEGVALDPSGSGAALAVGGGGTIVRYEPGVAWDVVASPATRALHDVAWPAPNQAWAIGERGTILRFDGTRWRHDAASGRLTTEALYALAFRSASDGIAVGAKGAILRFDGTTWRADRQSRRATTQRLLGVAFAGVDAIAVGEQTTILIDSGSGWTVDRTAPERFKTLQEGRFPSLMTVAGLPDGRAFIGGELSILLERVPGKQFDRTTSFPMFNGSVVALALARSGGRLRLAASIAGEPSGRVNKYGGSGLIEPTGWLFVADESEWRLAGDERVAESGPDIDTPVRRDAVYDVALDADGRGFAVGGYPADLLDDDAHLSTMPSGSIWRLSLAGAPEAAPNHTRVPVKTAPGSIGFAYLADSACGVGLCSAASGMGARADGVLAAALADVEQAVAPGDVRFVAFGGDFRRFGIPDELASIRGMLDSLSVPSFAAIGDQDLFGGVDAAGESLLASNGYYLSTFADRPAPWGHTPPPPGIKPVSPPGEAPVDSALARTHYAFDYTIGGRAVLRMVFLDTSRPTQEIVFQNPQADQDAAWLRPLLTEAAALNVPAVVVMHDPLLAGIATGGRTGTLSAAVAGTGVSAVLASHQRVNRLISYADPVQPFPVALLGTTGGGLEGSWKLEAGAYHAWFHVNVPVGGGPAVVRSIPVLESVALSAPQGRSVGAGETLRFSGLGRLPDVGGAGDPAADRAQYLAFPMKRACSGALENPNNAACVAQDALRPDHVFACEDARICRFVREDASKPGVPLRNDAGEMILDDRSGLMCGLAPGRTNATLRVGTVQARVPVTVTGGDGACIPARFQDSIEPTVVLSAQSQRAPVPGEVDPPSPILKPKTFEVAAIPALAPPPIQPAPAPPGGGAPKHEEERESATEKAEMTALDPAFRRAASRTPGPATGGMLGFVAAAAAIALTGRLRRGARPQPACSAAARPAYAGSPPHSFSIRCRRGPAIR